MKDTLACRACNAPVRVGELPGSEFVLVDAMPTAGEGPGFALAGGGRVVRTTTAADGVAFRGHWATCRGIRELDRSGAVRGN